VFRTGREIDPAHHFVGPDGIVYRRDEATAESRGWTRRRQLEQLAGAPRARHEEAVARYFPLDRELAGSWGSEKGMQRSASAGPVRQLAAASPFPIVDCTLKREKVDVENDQTDCVYDCNGQETTMRIPGIGGCRQTMRLPMYLGKPAPAGGPQPENAPPLGNPFPDVECETTGEYRNPDTGTTECSYTCNGESITVQIPGHGGCPDPAKVPMYQGRPVPTGAPDPRDGSGSGWRIPGPPMIGPLLPQPGSGIGGPGNRLWPRAQATPRFRF
jgi:hypothetical protein